MKDWLRRPISNVLAMAYRETRVIRHDKAFLGAVLVQPVILLLLYGLAISNEPANVRWVVLDQEPSAVSRRLVAEVEATGYFDPPRRVSSYREGEARLQRGEATLLLVIPRDFRRDTLAGRGEIQLLLDGSDPLISARVASYVAQVALHFDAGGRRLAVRSTEGPTLAPRDPSAVDLRPRFWFNPTLRDRDFFLAAIAGMLLTNVCFSVTSLGLVGERESGTYEQTLSLPTSPLEIVLGKLLPYVVVSYAVLGIATLGAGLGFGIWPRGSWLALLVLTLPFVLASLAIGVLLSSAVRTTAQAVFLTIFLIMPSMVLSGVMIPYQLMPDGIRQVGALVPLRWYQIGLRRIVLRGGGFAEVWVPMLALLAIFAVLLVLLRWRVKPRLG